jgi:hypothetical protein
MSVYAYLWGRKGSQLWALLAINNAEMRCFLLSLRLPVREKKRESCSVNYFAEGGRGPPSLPTMFFVFLSAFEL